MYYEIETAFDIGDKVYLDPHNEDTVIIKSKSFADKLRKEQ